MGFVDLLLGLSFFLFFLFFLFSPPLHLVV